MKKSSLFYFIIALVAINLSFGLHAYAQKDPEKSDKFKKVKNAIPNRYIVVLDENVIQINDILPGPLKGEVVSQVSRNLASAYGGRIHSFYAYAFRGYAVEMSKEEVLRLSQDPRVRFVEEDSIVTADQTTQNQPQKGFPWGLDRIDQRQLPFNGFFSVEPFGTHTNNTLVYNNGTYTYTKTSTES